MPQNSPLGIWTQVSYPSCHLISVKTAQLLQVFISSWYLSSHFPSIVYHTHEVVMQPAYTLTAPGSSQEVRWLLRKVSSVSQCDQWLWLSETSKSISVSPQFEPVACSCLLWGFMQTWLAANKQAIMMQYYSWNKRLVGFLIENFGDNCILTYSCKNNTEIPCRLYYFLQ